MPTKKADKKEVLATYYGLLKQRLAEGRSERGLNTEVGERFGLSGQRVGQIIKKHEADLAQETESKINGTESKRKEDTFESKPTIMVVDTSKDQAPDPYPGADRSGHPGEPRLTPKEKWEEAVSGRKSTRRGGGTAGTGKIDEGELKDLKVANRQLRSQISDLEARLATLEQPRQQQAAQPPHLIRVGRGVRQAQVLMALSALGREANFDELAEVIGCSISAVKNSIQALVRAGKVKVRRRKERRGSRAPWIVYARLA